MPKKTSLKKREDIDVDHIRARSIELVDAAGKTRATLIASTEAKNRPSSTIIQLYGADGLPKLDLQVVGDSPGIRLTAANDRVGFSVAVNESANGIMIGDHQGRPVIQIGVYHEDRDDTPFGSKPAIVLSDFEDETQSLDVAIKECKIIQPPKKRK